MKKILTVKGQTLTDIAIQEYGNACAVFEIIDNNPGLLSDFGEDQSLIEDITQLDVAYPLRKDQEVLIDTESSLINKSKLEELNGEIIISE